MYVKYLLYLFVNKYAFVCAFRYLNNYNISLYYNNKYILLYNIVEKIKNFDFFHTLACSIITLFNFHSNIFTVFG